MAEEEGSTGMTEVQRRREERRRKILQNPGSRLQKILGPNTSVEDIEKMTGFKLDGASISTSTSSLDYTEASSSTSVNTSGIAPTQLQGDNQSNSNNIESARIPAAVAASSTASESPSSTPTRRLSSGNGATEDLQGELPLWIHQLVLCVLGIILPVLDLNYFLIYFLAWQLTVWKVFNGIKEKPAPPNLLVTLILVMGLTEQQIVKCQRLIRVLTFLWADFCLFFMSTALSQIIFFSVISSQDEDDDSEIEIVTVN